MEGKGTVQAASVSDSVGIAPAMPFIVVGVGASAGGLEALQEFFHALPADSGMAFIVIQHLSPDFKSMMVELLSRHSAIEVTQAVDGTELAPDHIYLLPPKKDLQLVNGRIRLDDRQATTTLHMPIDTFLQSLAGDQGEQSVAVILSGTGTDGTRGLRSIKEAGGLVMVQQPTSAKFDGMPNSAIATGLADVVLPPDQLATELLRFAQHPFDPAGIDPDEPNTDGEALQSIFSTLRQARGVDFSQYKAATMMRRLLRRLAVGHHDSLAEYAERVKNDPAEVESLLRELLIGVTRFFRDPDTWEALGKLAIPPLLRDAADGSTIRIWVTACSTGEEAYTVAMLVDEAIRVSRRPLHYRVFATDTNRDSLSVASVGEYSELDCAVIPQGLRDRHFERRSSGVLGARRALRGCVTFAEHNLLSDPPFTRLDLVLCRNLLIYLRPDCQQQVLARLHFGLRPGGFLYLGTSETVSEGNSRFRVLDGKAKIFQAMGGVPSSASALMSAAGHGLRSLRVGRGTARPSPIEGLYEKALRHYVPPGVAVDDNFEVVHLFGGVSRLLSLPAGRMNANLLRMLPQSVSVVLGSSARKAVQTRKEVRVAKVEYPFEESHLLMDLRVIPLERSPGVSDGLLVFFENIGERNESPAPAADLGADSLRRIRELEEDLQITREHLHTAVQDLEASNEELQATNEELVASNEELQSTNEELQSVNEELYTVNTEHQRKIGELEELNDDLESLLASVDVGVVFLDVNLRVRRFNEFAKRLFPLRAQDVGRPISEIAIRADYPGFHADVDQVRLRGTALDRRMHGPLATTWKLTVRPLRRHDSRRGGVIVAFYDTSEQRAERLLLERLAWCYASLSADVEQGNFVANLSTRALSLSAKARELLSIPTGANPNLDEFLSLLAPYSRAMVEASIADVIAGNTATFEATWLLAGLEATERAFQVFLQPERHPSTRELVLLGAFQPTAAPTQDPERPQSAGVVSEPLP
jgi:two-component system CheB/CheR fusion protein